MVVPSVQSVQFATARSVVYQSRCAEPPVDLYSVDPNGGIARAITHTSAEETEPALSPDGTQVAYVRADARGLSCKGCPATIWIMNADGTNQHALTQPQTGQWDYDPSWSPDGTQIVFSRWYAAGARPPTTSSSSVQQEDRPAISEWSARARPGGQARSRTSKRARPSTAVPLWSVAPDGTGQREIAGGESAYLPTWSRAGELAYVDQQVGRKAVLVVGGRRVSVPFARIDDLVVAGGRKPLSFSLPQR